MMNARLAGRLERYHQAKVDAAKRLQKNGLDGLPDHFWHVQVRRADDGQCIFTGFITAKSMAAAFREAARHWPGCAIRIKGKDAPAANVGASLVGARQGKKRRAAP